MGDTTTPQVGLIKPAIGASRSTWGNKWNGNADTLDLYLTDSSGQIWTLQQQVAALQAEIANLQNGAVPVGAVICWPTDINYPPGYLICDGSWHSANQYPALFAAILGYFGWDGGTNFALPDYRGCVLAHDDMGTGRLGGLVGSDTPGDLIGAPFIALNPSQMPSHAHGGATDTLGAHPHNYLFQNLIAGEGMGGGSGVTGSAENFETDYQGNHSHSITTDYQGGGQEHSNIQVSAIVLWLIRAV